MDILTFTLQLYLSPSPLIDLLYNSFVYLLSKLNCSTEWNLDSVDRFWFLCVCTCRDVLLKKVSELLCPGRLE